jgi:hypothetical protein
MAHSVNSDSYLEMVAIGGIADIVQHRHEMARSRMTQRGHCMIRNPLPVSQFEPLRWCPEHRGGNATAGFHHTSW